MPLGPGRGCQGLAQSPPVPEGLPSDSQSPEPLPGWGPVTAAQGLGGALVLDQGLEDPGRGATPAGNPRD